MKKLFSLFAAMLVAVAVNAQEIPSTDFAAPGYTFTADAATIIGNPPADKVYLDETANPHHIAWSDVSKTVENAVIWKINATRGCYVTVSLDLGPVIASNKHIFCVEILDANGARVDTIAEGPNYTGDGFTDHDAVKVLDGQVLIPAAGEYTIQLKNNRDWSKGSIKNVILTYAADAPEPQHTYTVAGAPAALFGKEWNASYAENDMESYGTDTYFLRRDSVALAAGNVEFVIVEDHSWSKVWPVNQNYVIKIDSAGLYNITIIFKPKAEVADSMISVVVYKVGDAVVLPTIILNGNFTGDWKNTENFAVAEDNLTASLKMNLTAGTYEFGMKFDGVWKANGAELTRANASTSLLEGENKNMKITADVDGEYIFTYTFLGEQLTVTYPPIITYIFDSQMGTIQGPKTTANGVAAENITFEAISKYGYHFVQWNDSMMDNPRTIWLSQDTTFTAEFAPNKYNVSIIYDQEKGAIEGESGEFDYLTRLTYRAVAKYGYHLDHWNVIKEYILDNTQLEDSENNLLWDYTKSAPQDNPDRGLYYASKVNDSNLKGIKLNSSGYCSFTKNAVAGILKLTFGPRSGGGGCSLRVENRDGESVSLITTTEYVYTLTTVSIPLTEKQNDIYIKRSAENETVLQKIQFIETLKTYAKEDTVSIVVVGDTAIQAFFAKNSYQIIDNTKTQEGYISGAGYYSYYDTVRLTAIPHSGYHFAQWSDGIKENPRTIVLTQDTTFVAEFAPNKYSVNVSCDPSLGSIVGKNGEYDYLSRISYEAVAHYGYQFAKWSDGNTQNPRTVTVQRDTTLVAEFAKRSFTLTTQSANPEQGIALGGKSALYLEEVEISATPNDGYTFVQWSDGDAKNPRIVVLTQDTTFVAEFAVAKSGLCGANNSLTWSYTDDRTLTISGSGALTENYTFGVEAPTQMKTLIIGNEVTAIGERAFYGKSNINHLVLGAQLATIGDYAFAECRNFDDITCYATTVPTINETTFANVGNKQYIYLYVPAERERAYKRDIYWGEFDVQIQEAEKTTVTEDEVTVTPTDNSAVLTWPTNENAASYTIEITKDGEVFCRLVFNANGQLTGIAFAPSPNGTPRHARTALMTANGLQFTITGLNSNTNYGYSVTTKDANDQPIASYSGEFSTTGEVPTSVDQVPSDQVQCTKILRNGQIFILRGNKTYTIQGQKVK